MAQGKNHFTSIPFDIRETSLEKELAKYKGTPLEFKGADPIDEYTRVLTMREWVKEGDKPTIIA